MCLDVDLFGLIMFETLYFLYCMPISFIELWNFQLLCLQAMCLFSFWEPYP